MEEPDVNESSEEQVTAGSESGDDAVSVDAEAVTEGASESVSEEAGPKLQGDSDGGSPDSAPTSSESESPGARARAESDAERAQRLAEARHGHGEDVETSDLICTVHGGELRQGPGKYRWVCDRTQTPGACVAGYRGEA